MQAPASPPEPVSAPESAPEAPVPKPVLAVVPARPRPRDVRDMNRAELEAYAMELKMLPRALELTDDRLRQNIQAYLQEMFEQ